MANEGAKRMLIDSIARSDKEIITFNSDIKRRSEEDNKLAIEFDKSNVTDSRKKSIINRRSVLQKEIVSLKGKIDDRTSKRNKDNSKLNSL